MQDGVHPAAETVGNDLEGGRGPTDRRPASDPLEWGLERGVSILPGVEASTLNGDSEGSSEEKDQKGRIIAGTGAIAPALTTILDSSALLIATGDGLVLCRRRSLTAWAPLTQGPDGMP